MPVFFRTLCSGSSGNAIMIWNDETRLLVDCGVRAQYRCREMLDEHASDPPPLEAVVVSHLHGDHVSYSGLRVLEERGVPVYLHEGNAEGLPKRHFKSHGFEGLEVRTFGDGPFQVGPFEFRPIPVPHAPGHVTHGFAVTAPAPQGTVRIVVATDLCQWEHAVDDLLDADLIYLEANHDPELLRKNPNPNSAYHLENSYAAEFLVELLQRSSKPPKAVMLAHLSEQRNHPLVALATVRAALAGAGHEALPVHVAPRHTPSPIVEIG